MATARHGSQDAKADLATDSSQHDRVEGRLFSIVNKARCFLPGFNNRHTSSPVQNIGHLFHGVSLASPNQVLKYGLRTAKGNTGGVSFEAPAGIPSSAEPAAVAVRNQCMLSYI